MAGITADKIKKNESIMGIIGSWEGYVPLATDIYYNGANPYGLAPVSSVTLDIIMKTPMCSCHGRISATWQELQPIRSRRMNR